MMADHRNYRCHVLIILDIGNYHTESYVVARNSTRENYTTCDRGSADAMVEALQLARAEFPGALKYLPSGHKRTGKPVGWVPRARRK